MEYLIPVLIILLSAVFLTAGVAKLIDFKGAKKAASEFGVPLAAAGLSTAVLICVEILVAFSLLFERTGQVGAAAANILLFLFLVATARLVIQGKSPHCRCFGQLSNEPVGKSSLVRNALLLIVAGVVLVFYKGFSLSGGVDNAKTTSLMVLGFALTGLMIASLLIALELLGRFDALEERLQKVEKYSTLLEMQQSAGEPTEGLPVGTLVPNVLIEDYSGKQVGIRALTHEGRPSLFVFVGPECVPCENLARSFPDWEKVLKDRVSFVVISSGDEDVNMEIFGEFSRGRLYLQEEDRASDAFRARWTPSAVLLDGDGRVASGPTAGDTAIERLVARIERTEDLRSPLYIGEDLEAISPRFGKEVPDFELENLEGDRFTKQDLLGQATMVVFWSLTCQFCTEMLNEMLGWTVDRDRLNLVIFADGPKKKLQETGLGPRLVIDRGYKIGETMGMFGTPSAVIIDGSGRVVSETVQGSHRIELLSGGVFGSHSGHQHS